MLFGSDLDGTPIITPNTSSLDPRLNSASQLPAHSSTAKIEGEMRIARLTSTGKVHMQFIDYLLKTLRLESIRWLPVGSNVRQLFHVKISCPVSLFELSWGTCCY
jgi:hypothetical protein